MKLESTLQNEADDRKPSQDDRQDFSKMRRLPAPKQPRRGEVRGGGFIVVERTTKKRLLRPSMWPVEVASLADAVIAAKRLRGKFPGREFCIFEQVGSFAPEA